VTDGEKRQFQPDETLNYFTGWKWLCATLWATLCPSRMKNSSWVCSLAGIHHAGIGGGGQSTGISNYLFSIHLDNVFEINVIYKIFEGVFF
jgi:hypothetical protein